MRREDRHIDAMLLTRFTHGLSDELSDCFSPEDRGVLINAHRPHEINMALIIDGFGSFVNGPLRSLSVCPLKVDPLGVSRDGVLTAVQRFAHRHDEKKPKDQEEYKIAADRKSLSRDRRTPCRFDSLELLNESAADACDARALNVSANGA